VVLLIFRNRDEEKAMWLEDWNRGGDRASDKLSRIPYSFFISSSMSIKRLESFMTFCSCSATNALLDFL
jgi:hypothetical protein